MELSPSGEESALPATAEKGYVDVKMQLEAPGGHSSIPPRHTASSLSPLLDQKQC